MSPNRLGDLRKKERRKKSVPVPVERRKGDRRSGKDRRAEPT